MTLRVTVFDRLERIVAPLVADLSVPVGDPFSPELVAVPTAGIRAWLVEQLGRHLGESPAGGDGIVANIRFPFPGAIVGAAAGVDPADDAWTIDRLVWPLLEVVDDPSGPLAERGDRARPLLLARRIADLFDRYHVFRPAMVRAWADGRPVDAAGRPLGARHAWQHQVWRAVRARIGRPSPPERLPGALEALRAGHRPPGLPARVALAGIGALPPHHLEVLEALGQAIDVHVLAVVTSAGQWAHVGELLAGAPVRHPVARSADPTAGAAHHRLVRSWSLPSRELQVTLAGGSSAPTTAFAAVSHPSEPPSLLARLQAALRDDLAVPARAPMAPGDRSVQVHTCHGPSRQVEVLHDAIRHLLRLDPTLRPADVLVVCPDLASFAPLVEATFSAGQADSVPVTLVDRSLRRANPVLEVLGLSLDLIGGRFAPADLLDLAARAPVRNRFGLDDDDLGRWQDWVDDLRIGWGLDGPSRADAGLPGELDAYSWSLALDRLLYGLTVDDAPPAAELGGVAPAVRIEGADIRRVGLLAELIARLERAAAEAHHPAAIGEWCDRLDRLIDDLCAVERADEAQLSEARRMMGQIRRDAAAAGGPQVELSLDEVRWFVGEHLAGSPVRAPYRSSAVTVTSLVPMRGVPSRVVCLLGFDDDVSAAPEVDPDDLRDLEPSVGDPDARAERRQLLLEAVLSASETLVITATGRDVRTNAEVPPATALSELVEAIEQLLDGDGTPWLVAHPRHAVSPRSYVPGALGVDGPWSFDERGLAALRTAQEATEETWRPAVRGPLPADAVDVVPLKDLVDAFVDPLTFFADRVLGLREPPEPRAMPGATLPLGPNPLERWKLHDDLLDVHRVECAEQLLADLVERWERGQLAAGTLPVGEYGHQAVEDASQLVEGLLGEASCCELPLFDTHDLTVDLALAGGWRIVGVIPDVCADRRMIVRMQPGKRKEKHDLRLRLEVGLLVTLFGEVEWTAHLLHRNESLVYGVVQPKHLGVSAIDLDAARRLVEHAVARYDRARRGPIVHVADASIALGKGDRAKAASKFNDTNRFASRGELLLFGPGVRFDDVFPVGGPAEREAVELVTVLDAAVAATTIRRTYKVRR
jgi:exodeoxyribonuclease V gamma subunit